MTTLSPSLQNMLLEEKRLWAEGFSCLSGMDEAGRGPLAGPVITACIYIPKGIWIEGVGDSKKLTEKQRDHLFEILTKHPEIHYGVGESSPIEIDEINIYQATIKAMQRAFANLNVSSDYCLVDGMNIKLPVPSEKLIKGDARSYLVAASSIIAKVTRDQIMHEAHLKWPVYGFDRHKGYGTQKHRDALAQCGPCEIHRKTFEPIKSLIQAQ